MNEKAGVRAAGWSLVAAHVALPAWLAARIDTLETGWTAALAQALPSRAARHWDQGARKRSLSRSGARSARRRRSRAHAAAPRRGRRARAGAGGLEPLERAPFTIRLAREDERHPDEES